MDGDWDDVGRLLLPPPGPTVPQTAFTPHITLAFDSSQELLWIGNGYGRVSAFHGTELHRYASFKYADGPVLQLLFHEKGVIALAKDRIHMATRRGPPIWHITNDQMKELRCMSYTSKGTSEIIVAGEQDQMFIIDVEKGAVTKQIPTTDQYTLMKWSRYVCAATTSGSVNFLDPITFSLVKTWKAHSASIVDMDAQNDFVVTCGCSFRQGSFTLDHLVNVFDLKNMAPASPIPFPPGPKFARLLPRMSTTSIVISMYGQIHVVDLMNPNTSNVKQANVLSQLTKVEIAPSGEAMAMADLECNVHLWGSPARIRFAELSNPVELADPEETHEHIEWTVDTPLSSIGMPYYREQLVSAWPSHMIFEIGGPPLKFDQRLLSSLTVTEWGSYTNNPRTTRRNQVENTRTAEKTTSLKAPKFLSEKAREPENNTSAERRISDVTDAVGAAALSIPVMYHNHEIKYSKFGIEDFDFGFYNKTPYSGLETHISNSYANPLLQVLHFIPSIRNLALQHTATSCINPLCLLCEMGFLFDMLEKAEGSTCQATNMLKTLSNHPQAGPLNLLEEEGPRTPLTNMLQGLNRFLLERIAQDWKGIYPRSPLFDQVLATSATVVIRCTNCGSQHTRQGDGYAIDMLYTPQVTVRNSRVPKLSFSRILKSSVECEVTARGWCQNCKRYQYLATRKTIHRVPPVLMLNAVINSPEAKQFWATPGWLPEEIGVITDRGEFFCYEGEDLRHHLLRGAHNITVYSLIGLAAEIESGQHQKSHLVSLVNVAHSRPTDPAESEWHLFNDFLVRPIKSEEALTFNTAWKLPSVIAYQIKRANNTIDNTWKQNLDTSLLYIDHNTTLGERTYRLLEPSHEAPGEGTIIALDTEFVLIRQAEIEVNSEGGRETIRPKVHALARVSVVRGSGEQEGLPFIDDYISIKEPIVDYLTAFSGIVHGDLDPRFSQHNLVPLKIAYKKLWILLNLGCKFLGHGLKQDFRVTNIHIPKVQIIDTSDFFYVKALRRGKLSLAFLAWYLLKEDIQLETHDSIEDARTALKLYRKYLEFQDAGILETILHDIYSTGSHMGWKPPAVKKDGLLIERTETPPILGETAHGTPGTGSESAGPTTPVRRHIGLAPGTGSGSGWTPGRGSGLGGSPLR